MPVLLLHKARSTCFEQAMVKRSMFENWGQPTTSNAEMKIQRSCLLSMQVPVPKILPKRLGLLQCIVFTPALMLCSAGIGAFPNGLSNMSMVLSGSMQYRHLAVLEHMQISAVFKRQMLIDTVMPQRPKTTMTTVLSLLIWACWGSMLAS